MPRRRAPPPEAPPELDADMRPDDLVDELRRIRFDGNEFSAIKIDADVRDYLVTALNARYASRRA